MKFSFCIFLQSPHQVDIKNVVECQKEFFAYFNALETRGYVVSTGSGQTLQQAPKIPESAEIMKNQATEPIVAYLLLPYLYKTDPK